MTTRASTDSVRRRGRPRKLAHPELSDLTPRRHTLPPELRPYLHADDTTLVKRLDIALTRLEEYRAAGLRAHQIPKPARQKVVLLAHQACGQWLLAGDVAGVGYSTLFAWKDADPEFARAMRIAELRFAERVEGAVFKRVLAGDVKDKGSAVLTIFAAKGLKPMRWRDSAPIPAPARPLPSLNIGGPNPYAKLLPAPPAAPPRSADDTPSPSGRWDDWDDDPEAADDIDLPATHRDDTVA